METMQTNDGKESAPAPEAPKDDAQDNQEREIEQDGEQAEDDALAAAQAEAAEYKDRYLRAAAEMENMKRRIEKERSDLLQYGLDKIMSDLLPVLDAFDKAHGEASSQHNQDNPTPLFEGLELLKKQLFSTLNKHGLSAVDPEGEAFDPNFHQAIQKIDSPDVDKEQIQDVFQKGYTLNNRLVRPAMVSVAVPSKEK